MKDYSVYVYFEDGKVLNDTLVWDINMNRDNTTCLDIDPDTLYALPFAEEQMA